jgi:hypothetical protein
MCFSSNITRFYSNVDQWFWTSWRFRWKIRDYWNMKINDFEQVEDLDEKLVVSETYSWSK